MKETMRFHFIPAELTEMNKTDEFYSGVEGTWVRRHICGFIGDNLISPLQQLNICCGQGLEEALADVE